MNTDVKTVVADCTAGSDAERLTFPQVVMKLTAAGVERYHADLVRAEKTFYLPNGSSHVAETVPIAVIPAPDFSACGVRDALRAVQAQTIKYKEFCRRIAAAGCVGYTVSLVGRRAVYYGRTGDTYVEPFPQGLEEKT